MSEKTSESKMVFPNIIIEVKKEVNEVNKFCEQDLFGFADWYCNGISNSERKSPAEMWYIYLKINKNNNNEKI